MKHIDELINEGINQDVQGSIRDWYRNYWKEQLMIKRRAKFIKRALKKYHLSQQLMGLIDDEV